MERTCLTGGLLNRFPIIELVASKVCREYEYDVQNWHPFVKHQNQ